MEAGTRSERTKKLKSKIIEVALDCFTELGYTNTTLALIRKKTGASTGSIYHHFKNKDQLASAVYLEGIKSYQSGYLEMLKDQSDAKQGIYAIVEYHLAWVSENKKWARFLNKMRHAGFMEQSEDDFKALNSEFMGEVGSWVISHIKAGYLKVYPAGLFGAILMGPMQEFCRMWLAGHINTRPEDAAEHLANAAWQNLKP